MSNYTSEQKELFVKNLRLLMQKQHLARDTVAKAIGLSSGTFKSYYYGAKFPKQEKLEKIANYFSVPVDALFTVDDPLVKRNEMVKFYQQMKRYFEELNQSSPIDIIDNFINSQISESKVHFTFLSMCNILGINIEYISTIPSDTLEELTFNAEYETDDIATKIAQDELKFVPDSELMKKLFDNAPDSAASIQRVMDMFRTVTVPNRVKNAKNKTGLELTANEIKDGLYTKENIADIPISVRIGAFKEITSLDKIKAQSLKDLLFNPKEYTLSEFIDLEEDFIDAFYDIFL